MKLTKRPALIAIVVCLCAQLLHHAVAGNEDGGAGTCQAGEVTVTGNNVKSLQREVAQISEVAITDGLDPDIQRETCNSIKDLGFDGARSFLEKDKGYNLVNVYEKVNCKVSLKKPNLIGFFVLEVNVIGKHFEQFKKYYESLPPQQKQVLKGKIKNEKNLDRYIKQTRADLEKSVDAGPIFDTVMGYLDMIEKWLNNI